jgi:hypothetical protein
MLKKLVLFGAFDRYNYGDNLMPILFQMYVEKYAKHLLDNFEFEYVAISSSNLEKFSCYPTVSINSVVDSLPEGSVVVVIGGEVLCGRNQSLFLHMQSNAFHHLLLKVFKKLLPKAFNIYAKSQYSTNWEFPFIPSNKYFSEDVKIVFNTVGGDLDSLTQPELIDVQERILKADYLSVRDQRTFDNMKSVGKETTLAPDSAYIMSDLLNKSDLTSHVSDEFLAELPNDYFIFQAAPAKVGCSVANCINYIAALAEKTGKKILLLPIGYASGHDDFYLLKKIHKALPDNTVLLHNLTIWEIMYAIMMSNAYFGTSLHGAITAMSFNIPHFGINEKITKLDAFLNDWSVVPFNKCYPIDDITKLPGLITKTSIDSLTLKTTSNISKVKSNYQEILACL